MKQKTTRMKPSRPLAFLAACLFFFILHSSLFILSARAQDIDESGRAALSDILNGPLSPRAAALGNTFVATPNDPNTIFSNPAALSSIVITDSDRMNNISVSYTHLVLDLNEGAIVYEHPVPENVLFAGNFAAGVQYFDGGTSTQADATGQTLGTFNTEDVALLLSYASTASNGLHYGVTAKVVSSSLVSGSSVQNYGATWMAADLGLYYEWAKEHMTFGLSVINLGSEVSKYDSVLEPVGPDVQLGATIKPEHLPLTLGLEFHNLNRDLEGHGFFYAFNDFSLGAEFAMGKVVRLRLGYDNDLRHELDVPTGNGFGGFSGGIGLHIKRYDIDFAIDDEGPDFTPFIRFGLRTDL
jgi:hypothetical protein